MAKLIKLETIDFPKVYVVGKEIKVKMEDVMGANNPIGAFWGKCMSDGTFEELSKLKVYSNDYVGFMTDWDMGTDYFVYSVGMLFNESTTPSSEYTVREIAPAKVAVSWVQGKDTADVCSNAHTITEEALREKGLAMSSVGWCMEVYNNPRYTTPDENGTIILDYYVPVEG